MWHAVSPVSSEHDPIVYEGHSAGIVSVINAGPGVVQVRAWSEDIFRHHEPDIALEMRPGNIRTISARLVRAHLMHGDFCAIAWRVEGSDG